jgi:hypothetical protein
MAMVIHGVDAHKIDGYPDRPPPGDGPLTEREKTVFGQDAKRHPITGLVLQQGSGAPPHDVQAAEHLGIIAMIYGHAVANEIRLQLRV